MVHALYERGIAPEHPGMKLTELTQKLFYGRTA